MTLKFKVKVSFAAGSLHVFPSNRRCRIHQRPRTKFSFHPVLFLYFFFARKVVCSLAEKFHSLLAGMRRCDSDGVHRRFMQQRILLFSIFSRKMLVESQRLFTVNYRESFEQLSRGARRTRAGVVRGKVVNRGARVCKGNSQSMLV